MFSQFKQSVKQLLLFFSIWEYEFSLFFRFQVDPSSPYAKPLKSSTVLNTAGKKGQLNKDIQNIQDSFSSADFKPPDDKFDDQNLTEDQMAWRYSSKWRIFINHT